jgi:hypothetical protein
MSSWFSIILFIFLCYISFPFVVVTYSIVCVINSGYPSGFFILILPGPTSFRSFLLCSLFFVVICGIPASSVLPSLFLAHIRSMKRCRWWLKRQCPVRSLTSVATVCLGSVLYSFCPVLTPLRIVMCRNALGVFIEINERLTKNSS